MVIIIDNDHFEHIINVGVQLCTHVSQTWWQEESSWLILAN